MALYENQNASYGREAAGFPIDLSLQMVKFPRSLVAYIVPSLQLKLSIGNPSGFRKAKH